MAVGLALGGMFGLGLWLAITALPWARPRPSLATRLQLLTARGRLEMEAARGHHAAPLFKSTALERLLRPLIEDAGGLLARIMSRAGVGAADLDRRLALGWPGMTPAHFYGQKLASGLVLLLLFPFMNVMGVNPFGVWQVWMWLAGFGVGFALPDWMLEGRLERRRTAVLMELPTMLDVLAIAASAGMSPEQALLETSRQMRGVLGNGLREVAREAGLGAATHAEGLRVLAEREQVPELLSLADAWQSALEQGLPLGQAMLTLAETVRERKRARLLEEGGKSTIRMLFPVALFIFPVFLVVLLYPAGVELLGLGG
ncbi:MAG TPA: type II secretion system F family protein [Dehalococcoidia bacterium]|nr:type II secretion system F family protein [Dehalococcoidia bacterium]